jgi:drug/metabolite transporter (DMT)-like permease
MVMSAGGFALMGALVKVAGSAGVPVMQIILARAIVSLAISLAEARAARVNPLGERRGLLLLRGVVGFLALSCVYYAMVTLPYAEATVLHYMHPIFTALLALALLKERPATGTLICVAFSIAGLLVMTAPSWQGNVERLPPLGIVAGLCAAAGSGLAYTIVRKLAPTEHPSVIVLYFPLVCVPATLLLGFKDFVWPAPHLWLVLLGVGVFTQVGQVSLTRAMQRDSASRNTSLSYIQIVFAALLGLLFFDEALTSNTAIGAGLIIVGALINARWASITRRPAESG